MITSIKVTDNIVEGMKGKKASDVLLFKEINNIKPLNILFGGNGVGKSTLLRALKQNILDIETNKEIQIVSFVNSEDNGKVNKNRGFNNSSDFVKRVNSTMYSEGQSIIHYVLSFIQDIKEMDTDKDTVVLLDEVDSGLSAENINMLLWQIKDLIDTKHVQFFISTNNYHFIYAFNWCLNMYTGKYQKIESYDEYFNELNKGIGIMERSKKREFNFLDIY